jgi:heat shock protein HslJ
MTLRTLLYALSGLLLVSCTTTQPAGRPIPTAKSVQVDPDSLQLDFRASGNEPSWMLTIDFKRQMYFRNIGTQPFELRTPVPQPRRMAASEGVNYAVRTEKGTLSVTITPDSCADAMSGEVFPYQVRVSAKTEAMDKMIDFEGCGNYQGESRLNDLWTLISIDGKPLDVPEGRKRPNIEFKLAEGQLFGYGGCNGIRASVSIADEKLVIGTIASTKVMCPQMNIEDQFTAMLAQGPLGYRIDDRELILTTTRGSTLTFRKAN